MLREPTCYTRKCKHFKGVKYFGEDERSENNYCAAFPGGIPAEIAYGTNPHTAPFTGDHGIMFEAEE